MTNDTATPSRPTQYYVDGQQGSKPMSIEEATSQGVAANEKVGHGSGGVVLLRAAAKGGQWLA